MGENLGDVRFIRADKQHRLGIRGMGPGLVVELQTGHFSPLKHRIEFLKSRRGPVPPRKAPSRMFPPARGSADPNVHVRPSTGCAKKGKGTGRYRPPGFTGNEGNSNVSRSVAQ